MRSGGFIGSVADLRRKVRAVAALSEDAGATEHERANAKALKRRLQQRLNQTGEPAGDWTDNAFRLGKRLREIRGSASPAAPRGDWTDDAFRLGKALRRGWKRW